MKAAKQMVLCGVEKGIIAADYELHGHRDQVRAELCNIMILKDFNPVVLGVHRLSRRCLLQ